MTKAEIDAVLLQVQDELAHLKVSKEIFELFEARVKAILPDVASVVFVRTYSGNPFDTRIRYTAEVTLKGIIATTIATTIVRGTAHA